jgi:hypothetical protein
LVSALGFEMLQDDFVTALDHARQLHVSVAKFDRSAHLAELHVQEIESHISG